MLKYFMRLDLYFLSPASVISIMIVNVNDFVNVNHLMKGNVNDFVNVTHLMKGNVNDFVNVTI